MIFVIYKNSASLTNYLRKCSNNLFTVHIKMLYSIPSTKSSLKFVSKISQCNSYTSNIFIIGVSTNNIIGNTKFVSNILI